MMSPSAFVFLPGQLTRRAELYHQLGQLTAAGLPINSALEQLERNPPAHAYRQPLRLIRQVPECKLGTLRTLMCR